PGNGGGRASVERRAMPALGDAAAEGPILLFGAEGAARRVACAAMSKPVDEVRAAVPLRVACGVWPERAALEVERLPRGDQGADVEWSTQLVGHVLGAHRLARRDVRVQRVDVFVGQAGVVLVRERRVQVASVAVEALAQRADEGWLGPAADAGVGVGRDVGTVERAERRFDRPTAGERLAAFGGMADLAIADRGELRALRNQRR